MDEEFLAGIEERLRERMQVLAGRALDVRERLDVLLTSLEDAKETFPRIQISADGGDIDFLVADILTLQSLIGDMRDRLHLYQRIQESPPAETQAGPRGNHLRLLGREDEEEAVPAL